MVQSALQAQPLGISPTFNHEGLGLLERSLKPPGSSSYHKTFASSAWPYPAGNIISSRIGQHFGPMELQDVPVLCIATSHRLRTPADQSENAALIDARSFFPSMLELVNQVSEADHQA